MIMISIIILIDISVVMTYTAGYIMIAMSAHEAQKKLITKLVIKNMDMLIIFAGLEN